MVLFDGADVLVPKVEIGGGRKEFKPASQPSLQL